MLRRHGPVEGRNAMAMRIAIGVPQLPVDALFKVFRNEVLQSLGFIVQFFDGVIQNFEKERFN